MRKKTGGSPVAKALRDPKLSRQELRALLAQAESEVEEEIEIAKKKSEQAVERARYEEERKARRIELKSEIGKLAGDASSRYLYEVGVKNKKLAQIREEQRVAKHLIERTEPKWMRAVDDREFWPWGCVPADLPPPAPASSVPAFRFLFCLTNMPHSQARDRPLWL